MPEQLDTMFSQWFINSNIYIEKQLASLPLSKKTLDSLIISIKKKPILSGNTTVSLLDDNNNEYILGYSTPKKIVPDSQYPLLLYLHGGIGVMRNDKGHNAFEMFRFLADTVDLFLASPSANKTNPWWKESGLKRILQSLRYLTLRFPIDPNRIFLAGVSDGALGCYAAANAINGPFAGFIPISGYGGLLPDLGTELYSANLMQRPFYVINGGKDHLYPIENINQFLDFLEKQGVSIERKIYPNEKHGFDYKEQETAKLLEIIRTWRKPQRTNISWVIVPRMPNYSDNLFSWTTDGNEQISSVTGYWSHDTLTLHTKGLTTISIFFNNNEYKTAFLKKNKNRIKPIKEEKVNTATQLKLMKHFCYPFLRPGKTYHIQL